MNRDDLLKRCVDRRVAHETSVVAVSHLFYVYLLSALKKGQRVEVPNFGTFGTHVVGVKRQRRMPFFEVENDLADKVNERYRNLKTLLVGTYELQPAEAETEYKGAEGPYDPFAARMGKEMVIDTTAEISTEEYRQKRLTPTEPVSPEPVPSKPTLPKVEPPKPEEVRTHEIPAEPPKEKKLMPRLNLRGEGPEKEPTPPPPQETEPFKPSEPPPTLRDFGESAGPSPLLQIVFGLLILAVITFALNYFGIIHLWGTRPAVQTPEESLPPVVQPAPQPETTQTETQQQAEPTPTPGETTEQPTETPREIAKPPVVTEEKKPTVTPRTTTPPAGAGNFTVQVSSWTKQRDADRVVSRLRTAGFDPYVVQANVKGRLWYRVRVGRYQTQADANDAAGQLRRINENGVWVTRINLN
ncbi:MAG: SPOR domain-containing protein [Ignavibacteriae bacterium]|nr:SPOR domain-containing protein [Ignavibacteriota bacterium]